MKRAGALLALLIVVQPCVAQDASTEILESSVTARLASRSLLLDGAVAGDRLVVVGDRGHILVSRDQGRTWLQKTAPTRAMLTAVFFHDENLGWAVGHDAVILRTRDGAESWERVHFAPEHEAPLLDVWFSDADHGIAIGAYSYFLTTSDGGDSWTSVDFAATLMAGSGEDEDGDEDPFFDFHLNQIARSAGGRLYIAAEAGAVLRSDNEGSNWIMLPSPYQGSFFGTLPLEGEALLLFGLRGNLFRSDDSGANWQQIESGTDAMLTRALRSSDGTIVICGLSGTLLVSRDGGQSFSPAHREDREGLSSILQTPDGAMILIGEFGVTRVDRLE